MEKLSAISSAPNSAAKFFPSRSIERTLLTRRGGAAYSARVPLPETIPVRYTEEEADNFSIRPVKRQTFRLRELVDMILCVAGKDQARVQQILHSGTIVYHYFRYWWQGFDADSAELTALLADFPSDDPQRAFRGEDCAVIILEPATPGRRSIEIERAAAERKPLFASKSFWDSLTAMAQQSSAQATTSPTYAGYSFDRRADLYHVALSPSQRQSIARDAARLAPRALRSHIDTAGEIARLALVCPRQPRS
jgi:hypothetical protein